MSDSQVIKDSPLKKGGFPIKFITVILFTVIGFVLAIVANILIPQTAEDVKFVDHEIGPFTVNMNGAYRVLVTFLALI